MSAVERAAEVITADLRGGLYSADEAGRDIARALADAGQLLIDVDRAVIQAARSMATQHKQNRPRTSGPCVCLVCEAVHNADAATTKPERGRG